MLFLMFLAPSEVATVTCLDCGEDSHIEKDEKKHWKEAEKHEPKAKNDRKISRSEKEAY